MNTLTSARIESRLHDLVHDVQAVLRSRSGAAGLDELFLRRLGESPASETGLIVVIAQTCLDLGHKAATRKWLERLARRADKSSINDLLRGIEIAAHARQAYCALHLCREFSRRRTSVVAEGERIAHAIVELALRMRIPRARNGAWATHRRLLEAARTLLEHMLEFPASSEQHAQCAALLERVDRLLGGSCSPGGRSGPRT